jgi:thiol-disulfide isomerase/thioredoxin
MKSRPNNSPFLPNRLVVVMISILVLSAAWTIISRVPEPSSQQSDLLTNLKEGFATPDFALDRLNGEQLTLSELRGQPIVLNLWASWCLTCRGEMPAIEKVYQHYKDSGLVVNRAEPDIAGFRNGR